MENIFTLLTKYVHWYGNIIMLMKFSSLLHCKLSKWQLPVQPVMEISSTWIHCGLEISVPWIHFSLICKILPTGQIPTIDYLHTYWLILTPYGRSEGHQRSPQFPSVVGFWCLFQCHSRMCLFGVVIQGVWGVKEDSRISPEGPVSTPTMDIEIIVFMAMISSVKISTFLT